MRRLARLVAAAAVAAPALALAQSTWTIDSAHAHAGFSIRHMVVSDVRGAFGKTTGTVKLDEKDVTRSAVEATLDVASIDTGVPQRDAHLRSPDFFDVARYPTITFRSTRIARAGGDGLTVTGDLTMHGVTRPVVLHVTAPATQVKDPMGDVRRGFSATAKLDRRDFGLTWNELVEAGPVVGDEVKVELDGELVRAGPKEAAR